MVNIILSNGNAIRTHKRSFDEVLQSYEYPIFMYLPCAVQLFHMQTGEVKTLGNNLYNGHTIEEIEGNFPTEMPRVDREKYIENCHKVIECQLTGYNMNEIEGLKNHNFNLISKYYQPC